MGLRMNRRRWMTLTAGAGLSALGASCASSPGIVKINASAAERFGRDGFGVWQAGKLLAGRNLEQRMPALSITKAFAALLVVRGVGEGWLELDRPLFDTIPEWRKDPQKRLVTVRMLVNQTAGFPAAVPALYRGLIADKGRTAIALPIMNSPGSQFRYGPASSEILAEVLRRQLHARGSTTEELIRDLMRRMGVSSPTWRQDGGGRFYLSTGAEFSVNDLGRLGHVVARLASGHSTRGLNSSVFQDLCSPRSANPMVAAGLWWNRNAAKSNAFSIEPEREIDVLRAASFWQRACLNTAADPEWLALAGSGGKRVYVLPSQAVVIARLDRARSWNDAAFLRAIKG